MCGRFTLRTPLKDVVELFELAHYSQPQPGEWARFNIAPSQPIAAVRLDEQSQRRLDWLRWGLVPAWADDPAIGNQMINARGETVATKPAFREAFRQRRCLIPADGFYEWKKEGGAKRPYYIHLEEQRPFAFAGLWERWRRGSNEIESCTIITTEANDLLRPLHNRMPVILDPAEFATWLDPRLSRPEELSELLRPYPDQYLKLHPVRTLVNSPNFDEPECIEQAEPSKKQGSLFD